MRDVSPPAGCRTLERIRLPTGVAGIEALRNLPSLKRLSFRWDNKLNNVAQTAAEFWQEYDAVKTK